MTSMNMNVELVIGSEEIFGLFLHCETDHFEFDFKIFRIPRDILQQIRPPTKREVWVIV